MERFEDIDEKQAIYSFKSSGKTVFNSNYSSL